MSLPRLDPQPRVGDQVFEAIRRAILAGHYPAGHRLRIRDIAQELGTSVMPVREAIRRLEELGLVESTPNRGAAVRGFTQIELLDVYAVRRLLETEAAAAGAARATEADISELRAAYDEMARAAAVDDVVTYLDADERFLSILYRASGNPVLLETVRLLWQRCRSYKIMGAGREMESGDPQRLLDLQQEILDAAARHDHERIAALTQRSIDEAMDRIRSALPA